MGSYEPSNTPSSASESGTGSAAGTPFEAPRFAVELPRGGGAVRGLGETFSANPATGSGTATLPIGVTAGRGGEGPTLGLSYDSASGNGSFGLGWSLPIPSITRRTDKGLPQYDDGSDSDTFMAGAAEELVIALRMDGNGDLIMGPDGQPQIEEMTNDGWHIRRYRPRVEGGFSHIERWSRVGDAANVHWRTLAADNTLSLFGLDTNARIADPADPTRIFSWLLSEQRTDKGQATVYRYRAEDGTGVDLGRASEANRGAADSPARSANRYLKRILYGNRRPLLDANDRRPLFLGPTEIDDEIAADGFMFEVVLDYGDHDKDVPRPRDDTALLPGGGLRYPWPARADATSSWRAGFDVRTARLCQRILMFHHFPDRPEIGRDCLISATELTYSDPPAPDEAASAYSMLQSAKSRGFLRDGAGGYISDVTPAVEYSYSQPVIGDTVENVAEDGLETLPTGVDGMRHRWLDLHGEGAPGIFCEVEGAWLFARNRSQAPRQSTARAAFGPLQPVPARPEARLSQGAGFMDAEGAGRSDLMVLTGSRQGFYRHDEAEGWQDFEPFQNPLNRAFNDPDIRFVDLDGDGMADVLITETDALVWHPYRRRAGFEDARRVAKAVDENDGPRVVFSNTDEAVLLADMSGDGLTDIVRIRNGDIAYWPNKGHGRFGHKIAMDGAPLFDHPGLFEPTRLRLADIDGAGPSDLVYLGRDGAAVYFNRAGNGWSPARMLTAFPRIDDASAIGVFDLMGSGTACLVWSSPLPGHIGRAFRFVDLMAEGKPHLLTGTINNMGSETRVRYAPSTRFAAADRAAGRPWIGKLPFPVHLIEHVENIDHVSRTRSAARYAYHHGCFDPIDRELCGFGMIERFDAETFEDYVIGVAGIDGLQDTERAFQQPPVMTRSWRHLGDAGVRAGMQAQWAQDYFDGAPALSAPALPEGLSPEDIAACYRSLRGATIREEVFSPDGSALTEIPYQMTETAFEVRIVQPGGRGQPPVTLPVSVETIGINYERDPDDPRVSHAMVLERDDLGNVLQSATVVYPRRILEPELPAPVRNAQARLHVTCAEAQMTGDVLDGMPLTDHRLRVAWESRGFEVTGVAPADGHLFTRDEMRAALTGAAEIPFEADADGVTVQKRLLNHELTSYFDSDFQVLPFGTFSRLGLGHRSYTLALTPGTVTEAYGTDVTAVEFDDAGYVEVPCQTGWWIPSGEALYHADPASRFFMPIGSRDAFGNETHATFDADGMLTEEVRNSSRVWDVARMVNDYRCMCPVEVTDPNGNRNAVRFDVLGRVIATAVMGKVGEGDGDTLDDPTTRTEYEFERWRDLGLPNRVRSFARETHGGAAPVWRESYAYLSGSGGTIVTKLRASPGIALRPLPGGGVQEVMADPRWVSEGRIVLNNKGNVVKSYEPYYSASTEFEDEAAVREIGFSTLHFYDPIGRVTQSRAPNGAFTRVEFNQWANTIWDANDTVLESDWYAERGSPDPNVEPEPQGQPERRAAWLAAQHANTPTLNHLDSLGRNIMSVSDLGNGTTAGSWVETDLTGRRAQVFDAGGRLVSEGFTSMTGQALWGESAEKGLRRVFTDITGAVVRSWDDRGRAFRNSFDDMRRPMTSFVREGAGPERAFSHIVFGDNLPDARARNLLGIACRIYDEAGLVRIPATDFKGAPTALERVFSRDYRAEPDWSALVATTDVVASDALAAPLLEAGEVWSGTATSDALGRPTQMRLPDGTVLRPGYDEGSILQTLDAQIGGVGPDRRFLNGQDFTALGQRLNVRFGNDVTSRYAYDPRSFRLSSLVTHRAADAPGTRDLQALSYIHDPVGNITEIGDAAQQDTYFAGAVVGAHRTFQYDAIYRLIRATGRELAGFGNDAPRTASDLVRQLLPHLNNAQAVRRYVQAYTHDLFGNLTQIRHSFGPQPVVGQGWTKDFRHVFDDVAGDRSNRLAATTVPGDAPGVTSGTYDYDAYGNMTRMPHLDALVWDTSDRLSELDLGGGGRTYYVYGLGGTRLKKVIERPGGQVLEWLYLGGVVIHRRRRVNGTISFERHTVHVAGDFGQIAQVDIKRQDDLGRDPDNAIDVPLIRYVHSDHIGSAALETDVAGNVMSYEEYHPFGTTAYRSGRADTDPSLKRLRFAGKERDDESGLYQMGARYFAPWLGRWTSSDPAGFADGLNMHAYCRGNPIMLRDPSGTNGRDTIEIMVQEDHFTGTENPTVSDFERQMGQAIDPRFINENLQIYFEPNQTYNIEMRRYDRLPGGTWVLRSHAPSAPPAPAPRQRRRRPPTRGSPPAAEPEPEPEPEAEADPAASQVGGAAEAVGGTAIRQNPPGAIIETPSSVDDPKMARLNEHARQRLAGRNAGPGNSTRARRNAPVQVDALEEFTNRVPPDPGMAQPARGHRVDMMYDMTGEMGNHWRDYIWEDGATNTNDGFRGWNLLRRHQDGTIAGVFRRVGEARFWHSPGFRNGMRWGGGAFTGVGFGLSGFSLYHSVSEGDVPMAFGDALGTAGGALELYAFGAATFGGAGTTVGGATVTIGGASLAALPLGIAVGGVGLAVTSGVSMSRAIERGDTAGAVAGGVGVVAGGALAVGGGIAVASAAGVAMAPALVAAAPVLIVAGAVAAVGVGIFHAGRYFDWW